MVISSEPAGHVHAELTKVTVYTSKHPKNMRGTKKVGVKVYSPAPSLI